MRRFRRAQRLSAFSVLAVAASLALAVQGGLGAPAVGPATLGAFAGPILRNPNC
jgi:hypothetical protein